MKKLTKNQIYNCSKFYYIEHSGILQNPFKLNEMVILQQNKSFEKKCA